MNMNTRADLLLTIETLQTLANAAYQQVVSDGRLTSGPEDMVTRLVLKLPRLSDAFSRSVALAKIAQDKEDAAHWWIDSDTRDELHVHDYED